jgi:hypothetical protein
MNLLKIITASAFLAYFIHQELNISRRIKLLMIRLKFPFPVSRQNLHGTKRTVWDETDYIKLLDCLPCWSFWTAVVVTFVAVNVFRTPLADAWPGPCITFLIMVHLDRRK